MSRETELRPAELLRPEDLLENTKFLLELGEPKAIRAVVLESMTALEVYVHVIYKYHLKFLLTLIFNEKKAF